MIIHVVAIAWRYWCTMRSDQREKPQTNCTMCAMMSWLYAHRSYICFFAASCNDFFVRCILKTENNKIDRKDCTFHFLKMSQSLGCQPTTSCSSSVRKLSPYQRFFRQKLVVSSQRNQSRLVDNEVRRPWATLVGVSSSKVEAAATFFVIVDASCFFSLPREEIQMSPKPTQED
ncbi:hypothetical protein BS78_08G095800 [Paspalum vaginatum]|nr:hypothetical protein BS78_08G095800 [Paspalum vaginatum]